MPRMSDRALTRRAEAAMCEQEIITPCPLCDEVVTCTVSAGQFEDLVTPCLLGCHLLSYYPWEKLTDDVLSRAQGELDSYRRHLADGGM